MRARILKIENAKTQIQERLQDSVPSLIIMLVLISIDIKKVRLVSAQSTS